MSFLGHHITMVLYGFIYSLVRNISGLYRRRFLSVLLTPLTPYSRESVEIPLHPLNRKIKENA